MTAKTCGSCALAACNQAGLVEVCERWTNTDDEEEFIEFIISPLKLAVKHILEKHDYIKRVEAWESEGGAL